MRIVKLNIPEVGWPLASPGFSFFRQTPKNSGIWGDYQFFINSPIKQCDYWVVFEQIKSSESCYCPPENTIFITGEPPSMSHYNQNFLNQFSHVISSNKKIYHKHLYPFIQGHPWFVNKNYDELSIINKIDKSKELSIVTSNKILTQGHRKRFQFAMKLKEYFGDRIDLFGNGIIPFRDKWDVLAPYKYSVIIENYKCDDWLTEKLFDCYLAECFPFYYGCENISRYYDAESYEEVDIEDFDGCINKIEKILENPLHYGEHQPYIRASKFRTLNKYNLFPNIINFIETHNLLPSQLKEYNTLHQNHGNSKISMFKGIMKNFWRIGI
jgi:hypothetical protein